MQKSSLQKWVSFLCVWAIAMTVSVLHSGSVLAARSHTVQAGESLWKIARNYRATVRDIRAINNLWAKTEIRPGQTLTVPTAGEKVHIVSAGESLWQIASWYGKTVDVIRRHNRLSGNEIQPGQALIIPAAQPQTAPQNRAGHSVQADAATEHVELLARLVEAEALAEPYVGKVAVAAVVLNRLESPLFPDTIPGIIYQRGQFEPVSNGWINIRPSQASRQAVRDALAGWDPTYDSLYFYNPGKSNHSYFRNLEFTVRIGNHWFYR